MTEREQADAFSDDLDKVVSRYADEFDLSKGAVVGRLMFKMFVIMHDACHDHEEGNDTEPAP